MIHKLIKHLLIYLTGHTLAESSIGQRCRIDFSSAKNLVESGIDCTDNVVKDDLSLLSDSGTSDTHVFYYFLIFLLSALFIVTYLYFKKASIQNSWILCNLVSLSYYVYFITAMMLVGFINNFNHISDKNHFRKSLFSVFGAASFICAGTILGYEHNPVHVEYIHRRFMIFVAAGIFTFFTLPWKGPVVLYFRDLFFGLLSRLANKNLFTTLSIGILDTLYTGVYFFCVSILASLFHERFRKFIGNRFSRVLDK